MHKVETSLPDYMPEKYKKHHIRIDEIEIFDQKMELVTFLSEETLSAPGLNIRDYFKEFLACWDFDKVLHKMAEDFQRLDNEIRMKRDEDINDDRNDESSISTYDEFHAYVRDNILSFMPPEYADHSVKEVPAQKKNGKEYMGISIIDSGEGVSCHPVFHCKDFYNTFQGTGDINSIMMIIADAYVEIDKMGKAMKFPDLQNFSEIKTMIGYSIVNENLNKEMLKDTAYKSIEDFAKVYRVFHFNEGNGCSARITKEILDSWGVSLDELDRIADENMTVLFPAVLRPLGPPLDQFGNSLNNVVPFSENENAIYILTNEHMVGGASTIFYPGLLDTVHNLVKDDFYILPSSTEEVFIVSKTGHSAKAYGEIVRKANKDVVCPEEVLADCIYEYSKEGGSIRKVPESMLQFSKRRGMER